MLEKFVLHVKDEPVWHTASDTYTQCVRRTLAHCGFALIDAHGAPDDRVHELWGNYTFRNAGQYVIKRRIPKRGEGKTEPAPERKLVGYRMGKHDKVYPAHIFTPVYEEEPSTYVTRESAQRAIAFLVPASANWQTAIDMLEAKPKERVKAGRA